jgi:hypothetical protein
MEEKKVGFEKAPKKVNRIGWGMAVLWVLFAGFGDLVNWIPVLGTAVAWAFWGLFTFYLWKTKHGLANPKRAVTELVSLALETFPALQGLPTMIVATIIIIFLSRLEDRTGLNVMPYIKPGAKIRLPRKAPPLNSGGVRAPRKAPPVIDVESEVVEDNE